MLKKKECIISKVKSKYWKRTHKFGIAIPKTVAEAKTLDKKNGGTLWWVSICQEMKNVRVLFDEFEGDIKDLPPGFQKIKFCIIFDVKMGENFRCKARMVARGHTAHNPSTLTYSSIVSHDSICIALLIAALNDLEVLACDIQNAYLTAPCREKIWTVAGPEFGSEDGKNMIIVKALYNLKSSGATFEVFLAETFYDLGYKSSVADPGVLMHPAIKPSDAPYWQYILCYADDVLSISHDLTATMKGIQHKFKLKRDKMEAPSAYLGADLTKMDNSQGDSCWTISCGTYCSAFVSNIEETLKKKGLLLPSKCVIPTQNDYKPEKDCTAELKADGFQWYQ